MVWETVLSGMNQFHPQWMDVDPYPDATVFFLKFEICVFKELFTTLPLQYKSISFNLVKGFSKFQSLMVIKRKILLKNQM